MRRLRFTIGKLVVRAELFDTPTADAIYGAVPFESRVATWGGEIYFPAPVRQDREDAAREVIEAGELAYRADGDVIVIGFGPTPRSEGSEIRLAAPANVWGRAVDDVHRLKEVEGGQLVRIEVDD